MIAIDRRAPSDPRLPLSRRELSALLERLMEGLGLAGQALSLTLVGDREMAGLNQKHLGCPGPTNVLAFESGDGQGLGDIALCVPACLREARLYGQTPGLHLARLLAHALLHLAGLEHGPEMESLTESAAAAAWAPATAAGTLQSPGRGAI